MMFVVEAGRPQSAFHRKLFDWSPIEGTAIAKTLIAKGPDPKGPLSKGA